MTTDSVSARILPLWSRTVRALLESRAIVRSECRRCHTQLRVDLEEQEMLLGSSGTLVDFSKRCPMVGCDGATFYLAQVSYGRPWISLLTKTPERPGNAPEAPPCATSNGGA